MFDRSNSDDNLDELPPLDGWLDGWNPSTFKNKLFICVYNNRTFNHRDGTPDTDIEVLEIDFRKFGSSQKLSSTAIKDIISNFEKRLFPQVRAFLITSDSLHELGAQHIFYLLNAFNIEQNGFLNLIFCDLNKLNNEQMTALAAFVVLKGFKKLLIGNDNSIASITRLFQYIKDVSEHLNIDCNLQSLLLDFKKDKHFSELNGNKVLYFKFFSLIKDLNIKAIRLNALIHDSAYIKSSEELDSFFTELNNTNVSKLKLLGELNSGSTSGFNKHNPLYHSFLSNMSHSNLDKLSLRLNPSPSKEILSEIKQAMGDRILKNNTIIYKPPR